MNVKVTSHKGEVINAVSIAEHIALTKVGLQAASDVRKMTPVGTEESTGKKGYIGGTLRNSISSKVLDNSVHIGTNIEYAPYQEFGTKKMKAANGGKGYLRPAIQENINNYKNIIVETLKNL